MPCREEESRECAHLALWKHSNHIIKYNQYMGHLLLAPPLDQLPLVLEYVLDYPLIKGLKYILFWNVSGNFGRGSGIFLFST